MLGASGYRTKSELKKSKGKSLRFVETSAFGIEYPSEGNGKVTMVGPCAYTSRKWYANITLENHKIVKVS